MLNKPTQCSRRAQDIVITVAGTLIVICTPPISSNPSVSAADAPFLSTDPIIAVFIRICWLVLNGACRGTSVFGVRTVLVCYTHSRRRLRVCGECKYPTFTIYIYDGIAIPPSSAVVQMINECVLHTFAHVVVNRARARTHNMYNLVPSCRLHVALFSCVATCTTSRRVSRTTDNELKLHRVIGVRVANLELRAFGGDAGHRVDSSKVGNACVTMCPDTSNFNYLKATLQRVIHWVTCKSTIPMDGNTWFVFK